MAPVLLVATSILYRDWLVFPILAYFSPWQWRTVAIVIAVILGALSTLMGLRASLFGLVVVLGLLSGGTWAAYSVPHDVATSLFLEFTSHLKSLWPDVLRLFIAAAISQLCCTSFLQRQRRGRS